MTLSIRNRISPILPANDGYFRVSDTVTPTAESAIPLGPIRDTSTNLTILTT